MTKAEKYIQDVTKGKVKVCEHVKHAVSRHVADLKRKDLVFDKEAAARAIRFIELLRHTKGESAGERFVLEPWQAFIVWSIFGWKNKNGTRRFRYAYVEIARKNGKTTFAAAIALYMLIMDREEGAEVYTAATTRDQAKVCFEEAQRMVRKLKLDSPAVDRIAGTHQHSIFVTSSNSRMQALASESDTLDGLNPHCSIIDEYHAHKKDDVYNVMKSGMGARRQPLQFVITTAGFEKANPCFLLRDTIIKILTGKAKDDTQFGIIYTLDKKDDWNNPDCWIKCNPNLGVSVNREFLINEHRQALINGASQEVNFKTKNLNIWTDAAEVWIPEHVWARNTHGIKEQELIEAVCYGGLDLASGVDFNAFVLLFPNVRPKVHAIKLYTWKPENKLHNNKEKKDYRNWEREGHIYATPGDVIDFQWISDKIIEICGQYPGFQSLSFDPYRAHHGTVQALQAYGIQCHDLAQTMRYLSEPTQQLEKMATAGEFEHFNNPLLAWMLGQAEIIKDSKGNIMMTKKDQLKKVDGVAALINAIAEWKTFEGQQEIKELDILWT